MAKKQGWLIMNEKLAGRSRTEPNGFALIADSNIAHFWAPFQVREHADVISHSAIVVKLYSKRPFLNYPISAHGVGINFESVQVDFSDRLPRLNRQNFQLARLEAHLNVVRATLDPPDWLRPWFGGWHNRPIARTSNHR